MAREYPSRVRWVDRSVHTAASERIPNTWLEPRVEGTGLGTGYRHAQLGTGTDPLSLENHQADRGGVGAVTVVSDDD